MKTIEENKQYVDEFFRRLVNCEIRIIPSKLENTVIDYKTGELADNLSKQLTWYNSNFDEVDDQIHLMLCVESITKAYAYGMIEPTSGIFTKYEELQITNKKLQNDTEEIYSELQEKENECSELRGRIKQLESILQKITPNGDFDV